MRVCGRSSGGRAEKKRSRSLPSAWSLIRRWRCTGNYWERWDNGFGKSITNPIFAEESSNVFVKGKRGYDLETMIQLYESHSLTTLADALVQNLSEAGPPDPLQPVTMMVPNQDSTRSLRLCPARKTGTAATSPW